MSRFASFFGVGNGNGADQQPDQPGGGGGGGEEHHHQQQQPRGVPTTRPTGPPTSSSGGGGAPAPAPGSRSSPHSSPHTKKSTTGSSAAPAARSSSSSSNNNNNKKPSHQRQACAAAAAKRKASKYGGNISPQSATALQQLESYADQLEGLENEVMHVETVIGNSKASRVRLLEAKDQIAQTNGYLEKLQYAGVDSIITAELDSGKELAREKRKALNQRCDQLRERLLATSQKLAKVLDALGSPGR